MLDIKFIRENLDLIKAGALKKHVKVDLDALIALDDKRRALLQSYEGKKAEQNRVSADVAKTQDAALREQLIAEMKILKEDMQTEEEELKTVMKEWQLLMVQVPNIPDMTVPEGDDDADNAEVRTWSTTGGDVPKLNFAPKSHVDLMLAHDMADFERGTKVAGFRGYLSP
jgi:seryl-tRNA synthetase